MSECECDRTNVCEQINEVCVQLRVTGIGHISGVVWSVVSEVCHELLRVGNTSCPTKKTLLCHFTDKLLYEAQGKRSVTEKLLHAPDHRGRSEGRS